MGYVFLGAIVLLVGYYAYMAIGRMRPAARADLLRWGVGGAAALLTAGLAFGRRIDLAVFTGAAAVSILRFGRLGPFKLGGGDSVSPDNISKVRSRYFEMELDHDSGTVAGRIIDGQFAGRDLLDLGELETRTLLDEVSGNSDSLSLLESWLDANRAGWREYFAETRAASAPPPPANAEAEAYAVLGLKPGATAEEIKAAHRKLISGVHPDHGGSSFLAARINEARDLLLKLVGGG